MASHRQISGNRSYPANAPPTSSSNLGAGVGAPRQCRRQRLHSPLEQPVLTSLLRRNGHLVKVLPRDRRSTGYRPTPEERVPLAAGHLLVLSAIPPT